MMLTVGQLAKKYGLSRSTLLYYDSIGLLSPNGRTGANYRLYSKADLQKMERIQLFRSAGLSLRAIAALLEKQGSRLDNTLEQRLEEINREMRGLRRQQNVILKILELEDLEPGVQVMDKQTWVSILRAAGLDDEGMRQWHVEYERTSPQGHRDFLESIGIEESEIAKIRDWSQAG